LIYDQARPQNSTPDYGLAAATSMVMVGLALLLSFAYLRVIHQSSRYAVVTGKGYRPKLYHLGPGAVALAWAFVVIETLLSKVLPVLALFWLSVNPFLRLPSPEAFGNLSFAAYQSLGQARFGNAVWNTVVLILAVPTATAVFALLISWVVTRSRIKGVSATFDVLAFLPHAVPHIVFAVGAIVLTLKFLPEWLPLYGTLALLIIVYVVTRLSFATRVYNASLLQIHRELDEAGYVFGLRRLTVLWTILRPLLTPALVYTWFWMALLSYRELTIPALLASRDNAVMSTQIWAVWQSEPPVGAALTLVMIGFMLPLMAIYFVLSRRVANAGVGGW
jgi:iron(III) transport system permease protein